jgi:hypothetical protein
VEERQSLSKALRPKADNWCNTFTMDKYVDILHRL